MRVTSRNRTLAHIRCLKKMADEVGVTKIVFTDLSEGYPTSFWAESLEYLLLVSLLPKGRTKMPSLTNFNRFSRVRLFYYDVFDRIVYLQLPEPVDLSGCFSTPSPNTSLSSSSSSSGVRSLRRKQRASNYLMGMARAPFKSRTLEKSLSPLAPSTSTFR